MDIISLDTFKQVRKRHGSIYSLYYMLDHSGIDEHRTEKFIDAVASDIGIRQIEKLKGKDLYSIADGWLLAYQEFAHRI